MIIHNILRRLSFVLLCVIIGGVGLLPTASQAVQLSNLSSADEQQKSGYQRLVDNASNVYVDWDMRTGTPDNIRFSDLTMNWDSTDVVKRAHQFLKEYKDVYHLRNPRAELKLSSQTTDELGMTHVVFQQRYRGVPVYGARLKVHFKKDGSIASVNGSYLPNIENLSATPKFTDEQAIALAKDALKTKLGINDDVLAKLELQHSSPQLYIYNHGLFAQQRETSFLVRRLALYSAKTALNQVFYINAQTGAIVHTVDNLQNAKSRETYTLADCFDESGTLIYNESGLVGPDDVQAATIHEYAGKVYDYYANAFGRDSYDNLGAKLKSYAHYQEVTDSTCSVVANANWDPDLRIMRYGENFLSLDIAGHEITHGVIQYLVGENSIDSFELENEPGALNESYADVFGEFSEFANGGGDWLIGTSLPNGPSRSMSNPHDSPRYWQPAHVAEQLDTTEDPCKSAGGDSGCVHYNEGITNNALYLLSHGGTNPYSNQTIATADAIGQTKAQQIYYRALDLYLDTNSNFNDAYQQTMNVCFDLNASDPTTYPLSNCTTIFNAFKAVGINTDSSFLRAVIEGNPR